MIKVNAQKVYAFILAYMLAFPALLNMLNEMLNMVGLNTVLDTAVLYGILWFLILLGIFSFFRSYKSVKLDTLCILLFFMAVYAISFLAFPQNRQYLFTGFADYATNPIYLLFLYSLPGYVFVRELKDYSYFKRLMLPFSYAVIISSTLVFFLSPQSSAAQYMVFSYNMLIHLFFLVLYKPKKHYFMHYAVVSLGLFAFVFGGARGAMIFFILAAVLVYVTSFKLSIKNLIICSSLAVGGIVFSFFKSAVLLAISSFLEMLSIDSRNFQSILNSELFNDNSRFVLYRQTIEDIGVIGKGFMGDRVTLGIYPHNIFLEIWYQFGTVLGTALVVLLGFCICRALLRKNSAEYFFIVLLLPCGFLKLLVTGSYLAQEPAFYILLGLCVNALSRSKKHENINAQHSLWRGQYRQNS